MSQVERKVEYVEPDDPERCQTVHGKGQCRYKVVPGSSYCPLHGGNKAGEAARAKTKRQYQLAQWQNTVDGFADDDEVKSLRGEIGITRMMLQETIARCKNSGELMMYTGRIGDLISKTERLVTSCHRLESNLGLVLDKSKILDLATQIVEIVGEEIEDEAVLERISMKIVERIAVTQGSTKEVKDG